MAVGFIALAGVAAETGVVMLIYLDHAWENVKIFASDRLMAANSKWRTSPLDPLESHDR